MHVVVRLRSGPRELRGVFCENEIDETVLPHRCRQSQVGLPGLCVMGAVRLLLRGGAGAGQMLGRI